MTSIQKIPLSAVEKKENLSSIKIKITQTEIKQIINQTEYEECSLNPVRIQFSDEFFFERNERKITSQFNQVINVEAPICQSLLFKRIITAWGFSRTGSRLFSHLSRLAARLDLKYTVQENKIFYWKMNQSPDNYYLFRKNGIKNRNAEDIAKEEFANGIKEIIQNQISLPEDDLIRETAKLFNYSRTGTNVEFLIKQGIKHALNRGSVAEKKGRIILK